MRRSTLALTAMLVVAAASAAAVTPVARAAGTLCVGSKPGCFATIQAAVNAAHEGDTITVAPGTYAGGVTIDVSVNLIGAGSNKTIIQGGGPVLTIGQQGGPERRCRFAVSPSRAASTTQCRTWSSLRRGRVDPACGWVHDRRDGDDRRQRHHRQQRHAADNGLTGGLLRATAVRVRLWRRHRQRRSADLDEHAYQRQSGRFDTAGLVGRLRCRCRRHLQRGAGDAHAQAQLRDRKRGGRAPAERRVRASWRDR